MASPFIDEGEVQLHGKREGEKERDVVGAESHMPLLCRLVRDPCRPFCSAATPLPVHPCSFIDVHRPRIPVDLTTTWGSGSPFLSARVDDGGPAISPNSAALFLEIEGRAHNATLLGEAPIPSPDSPTRVRNSLVWSHG